MFVQEPYSPWANLCLQQMGFDIRWNCGRNRAAEYTSGKQPCAKNSEMCLEISVEGKLSTRL